VSDPESWCKLFWLWIEKLEETGSDGNPILLVDSEGTQTVPRGLGPAAKGAVKLLDFSFVVPIANLGGNLHFLNQAVS
jgi:hypothetical protein